MLRGVIPRGVGYKLDSKNLNKMGFDTPGYLLTKK